MTERRFAETKGWHHGHAAAPGDPLCRRGLLYIDKLDERGRRYSRRTTNIPSRYTRWDTAVVDPPPAFPAAAARVWIDAYNERGGHSRPSPSGWERSPNWNWVQRPGGGSISPSRRRTGRSRKKALEDRPSSPCCAVTDLFCSQADASLASIAPSATISPSSSTPSNFLRAPARPQTSATHGALSP